MVNENNYFLFISLEHFFFQFIFVFLSLASFWFNSVQIYSVNDQNEKFICESKRCVQFSKNYCQTSSIESRCEIVKGQTRSFSRQQKTTIRKKSSSSSRKYRMRTDNLDSWTQKKKHARADSGKRTFLFSRCFFFWFVHVLKNIITCVIYHCISLRFC